MKPERSVDTDRTNYSVYYDMHPRTPRSRTPARLKEDWSPPENSVVGLSLLNNVLEELDRSAPAYPRRSTAGMARNSSFDLQMDHSALDKGDEPTFLEKRCPVMTWIPSYKSEGFKGDLIAGLSVGLMMVPQSIAHAAIAGISPIFGLYTGLVGGLVYPSFASCRHLAVGTGAVIALLTGGVLDDLVSTYDGKYSGSEQDFRDNAGIFLCFFVGLWQLILGIFGLGYIQSFLSSPVMNGSLCGAAFVIMSTQLKHLIGVQYERSSYFFVTVFNFFAHLKDTKWLALIISIFSLAVLVFLRNFKRAMKAGNKYVCFTPNTCISNFVWLLADFSAVVVSIIGLSVGAAISSADREDLTPLVGSLPPGLLKFTTPFNFSPISVTDLIFPSFVMGVISFVLAIALAKKLGQMFNYPVDASQELIALGLAGVAGSFMACFPMQSSLSRTMVNVQSGALTSVAGWIAAAMVFLGILCLKPALYYLPKASLAAIIEIAALKLVDFEQPAWLYKMHKTWGDKLRSDWAVWMAAFFTTLGVGVVYGITLGLAMSCLLLIERSSKPKYAILGRLPDSNTYRSVDNFPDAMMFQSVIVVRFDASLHFANASYFRDLLHQIERTVQKSFNKISRPTTPLHPIHEDALRSHPSNRSQRKLKGVVVDMGSINEIDASGIQILKEMCIEYKKKNLLLLLANMKGSIRSMAARSKLTDFLMQDDLLIEVHDAVVLCDPHVEDQYDEIMTEMEERSHEYSVSRPDISDWTFDIPAHLQMKRTESALAINETNIEATITRALIRQSPLIVGNVKKRRKSLPMLNNKKHDATLNVQDDFKEQDHSSEINQITITQLHQIPQTNRVGRSFSTTHLFDRPKPSSRVPNPKGSLFGMESHLEDLEEAYEPVDMDDAEFFGNYSTLCISRQKNEST